MQDAALLGLPHGHELDGLVFAAPARPFAGVMVAGRWITPCVETPARRFEASLRELWQAHA
jgi:formimidoylglutamate deiminase